ncbi:unnamed protein product [Prunus armeniaca]|uniref:Auxin response factor domain-containing protein n=1 Tax=Prunus armeniaca TaxID=36596 RepID=A0A6J5Y5B4_PRUAR|nr:unnamed protein product [Prunus armeniaca]
MPNESLLATHLFMFTGFMRVQWCSGMRFKMAFETEDSSRISWFMGTIAFVQVVFLGLLLHVVLFGLLVGTRERTIRFLLPRIMSCLASFALYQFVKILESGVSRFWLFSFG